MKKQITLKGKDMGYIKQGSPHPTDKTLVYYFNNKGKDIWIKKEKLERWRRYDGHYSIYYLPKENYCGSTKRLLARMADHRRKGRNTDGFIVLCKVGTKREALEVEKKYQSEQGYKGSGFGNEWRKQSSDRIKNLWKTKLLKMKARPIRCIETGEIFESARFCARKYGNKSHGNLIKHLKRQKGHNTFCGKTFDYI